MTAGRKTADASSDPSSDWEAIDWKNVGREVKRLQDRIAKAVREDNWRKVKALQWLLTRSFHAKLLVVKRVASNKGKRTPGVDGKRWNTPRQKWEAAQDLQRRGYKPQPLWRIYIPKKNGKKRALSIPVMKDRAMQALYKLALDPIAETMADPNSYGFRVYRSCADAIQQCFISLAKSYSATWILEGDIKACFDGISHEWLLANVPMDQGVLRKWLKAGYVEGRKLYPTEAGTPQGGIISPVLANLALDGMEAAIRKAVPLRIGRTNIRTKINVIRYADDFIITAHSKELLVEKVLPALRSFLKERGLELSEEKTRITRIDDGFDFLSQNIRKYSGKLLIRPVRESVRSLLRSLKETMRRYLGDRAEAMIRRLNSQIRGWANYHRHVSSADTFSYIDRWLYRALRRWTIRRHPNKDRQWLKRKYWSGPKGWFSVMGKTKQGRRLYQLVRTTSIGIVRHIKIQAEANPFDPAYDKYFAARRAGRKTYAAKGSKPRCLQAA
jgi:RNA-directed DNA polymerase